MALQHLTSSTANKRPTPAVMSNAQLAINSNTSSPGLFFKDSAGALIKVGPVHVGSAAPNASPASGGETGNTVGEQWLDTTGGTYVFKVWDGSAWRSETGTFVDVNGDVMTGALGIIAGSAGSPGLYFSGDTNTGLYSPGADQVAISTNGTGRLFVDSSGNVGVGTASPARTLHVAGSAVFSDTVDTTVWAQFSTGVGGIGTNNNYPFAFATNGTERARIDSSGRLLVGTSSARANYFNSTFSPLVQFEGANSDGARLQSLTYGRAASSDGPILVLGKFRDNTVGGNTVVASGDQLGWLSFQGSDGTQFVEGASIRAEVDGTPGADDMPGRLVFSTTADGASSPTERMRITNGGNVFVGNTTGDYNTVGVSAFSDGNLQAVTNNRSTLVVNRKGSDGVIVDFYRDTNNPGTISVTTTATAYNTSSDYRLKENIEPIEDAAARVLQLNPCRFNFIADPDRVVDGFIAHEVQDIVPEAITGEKDAVDDEGNPQYQGIDQSKLVPLLTAALQEAVAKIESLEARLTAAGL
jgi:hypothetical protein